jgi:hypothetical protein
MQHGCQGNNSFEVLTSSEIFGENLWIVPNWFKCRRNAEGKYGVSFLILFREVFVRLGYGPYIESGI